MLSDDVKGNDIDTKEGHHQQTSKTTITTYMTYIS